MVTEGLPSQSRLRRDSSPGGRAKFYLLEESFQILPWTPPSQSETAGETGRTKPPARWGQWALSRGIYRVVQLVGSYPASFTASIRTLSATSVESSTVAFLLSRSTMALATPGTPVRAFCTWA